jgi:hypothetical protein
LIQTLQENYLLEAELSRARAGIKLLEGEISELYQGYQKESLEELGALLDSYYQIIF